MNLNKTSHAKWHALVLAAGKGRRFKSRLPKVLHPLCGKPLLGHVLKALEPLSVESLLVMVGHEAEAVRQVVSDERVAFLTQEQQHGTGHALLTALPRLRELEGNLLVVYGDTPLIRSETLQALLHAQETTGADQVLLTCRLKDPEGYGRVIRDAEGHILNIVEELDATEAEKQITEINTGIAVFRLAPMLEGLKALKPENEAGELYLTDLVAINLEKGYRVEAVQAKDPMEVLGVNTRAELADLERHLRRQINHNWMLEGVSFVDPDRTYVDADVTIGPDTVIFPGVILKGKTRIGARCHVHGFCHLENAVLADDVTVDHSSVIRDSSIGDRGRIGPFAHVKQGSDIGAQTRVGNFVEVKNTILGRGSKAAHLTYLGDAEIGRHVNIGAGTITCNYDGVDKYKTHIDDFVFVGSDSQLIAPVSLQEGCYIAAGSTITDDVPPFALAIARGRQVNKEDRGRERAEARRKKVQKRESEKESG